MQALEYLGSKVKVTRQGGVRGGRTKADDARDIMGERMW